jgi:hypothetical protein
MYQFYNEIQETRWSVMSRKQQARQSAESLAVVADDQGVHDLQ